MGLLNWIFPRIEKKHGIVTKIDLVYPPTPHPENNFFPLGTPPLGRNPASAHVPKTRKVLEVSEIHTLLCMLVAFHSSFVGI